LFEIFKLGILKVDKSVNYRILEPDDFEGVHIESGKSVDLAPLKGELLDFGEFGEGEVLHIFDFGVSHADSGQFG
jgi:hypothetical protein